MRWVASPPDRRDQIGPSAGWANGKGQEGSDPMLHSSSVHLIKAIDSMYRSGMFVHGPWPGSSSVKAFLAMMNNHVFDLAG